MTRAKASDWLPLDHLAHLDRTDRLFDGVDIVSDLYYTLHPVQLPRPDSGVQKATIVCGSCRKTVRCKAYSVPATERAYRRTSAVNLTLLLIMVIGVGAFNAVAFGKLHGTAKEWILPVSLAAAFGPVPSLMRALWRRRPDRATGVRLLRSKGHSLRAAGSTHSCETTPMPNI